MTHVLQWGFEHQAEFLLAPYARGDLAKEISSKLNNQVFLLASELNCQSWDASHNTWEGLSQNSPGRFVILHDFWINTSVWVSF